MVQYIRGRCFGNYLKIHGPLLLKSSRVAIVFFWGGWLGIARQPWGLVIRVDLLSTFHTFARVVGLALLLVLAFCQHTR